jgi:uncharacterized membrane protein YbhN (UPF0104 family)
MGHLSHKQKVLLAALKVLLAVVILGWLFVRIQENDVFSRLLSEPKHWPSLAAAQALVLVAFSLNFVRWYLLVRGLHMDFHLRDSFRLSTLGFLFNQISPGSMGGDLLKAVFIAKEQHGKKTEAVATVVVDRMVGLYAMLLVGSLGLALVSQEVSQHAMVQKMQVIAWSALAVGTLGFAWVLSPLATGKRVRDFADRLPIVGHTVSRLIDAVAIYRCRLGYIFASVGLGVTTHCLLILAFWCISRGLPVYEPTLFQNASIVPPSLLAGALPLTPGGLGTMEGAVEFFYVILGAQQGDGTIVALAYRAMTYVVAAVGAGYYLTARKKIDTMIHEAEELAEELE